MDLEYQTGNHDFLDGFDEDPAVQIPLFICNILLAAFCSISIAATLFLVWDRDLKDKFVKVAIFCLLVAMSCRAIMCLVWDLRWGKIDYHDFQEIYLQQICFEIPFYCFDLVNFALLCSWY